ncbi:MAG: hypothetical protein ABNH03_07955 [Alteromonas sp.]
MAVLICVILKYTITTIRSIISGNVNQCHVVSLNGSKAMTNDVGITSP